jgi:hypothetical protein
LPSICGDFNRCVPENMKQTTSGGINQLDEVTHPLQESFRRLQTLSSYLQAEVGRQAGEGWCQPLAYFAPGSPQMAEASTACRRKLASATPQMVASSLLQNYQWLVIGCAIGCFLLDRRVPDLAVDQLQVLFAHGADAGPDDSTEEPVRVAFASTRFAVLPGDAAAHHPDAWIVPDEAALRAHLRTSLEAHFAPILQRLHACFGAGERGLWLNVADRSASSLIWLMQELDPAVGIVPIRQELDPLLRNPVSPLYTTKVGVFALALEDKTHCFHERATCCYWYRTEGGDYCSTCPRRKKEDRNAQLLGWLAEHLAEADTGAQPASEPAQVGAAA